MKLGGVVLRTRRLGGNLSLIAGALFTLFALGIVGLVWIFGNERTDQAILYLDNGTSQQLSWDRSESVVVIVEPHSAIRLELEAGTQDLKLLDGTGKTVVEERLELPAAEGTIARRWVYNVSGANQYDVYGIVYGQGLSSRAPQTT